MNGSLTLREHPDDLVGNGRLGNGANGRIRELLLRITRPPTPRMLWLD
jgi:hypothetical protein